MVYGIYTGNKKWGGTGEDYSAQGFNSFFEIYWFCFFKKKLLGMPFQVQGGESNLQFRIFACLQI